MSPEEFRVVKDLVKIINGLELFGDTLGMATFIARSSIVEEMDAIVIEAQKIIENRNENETS